MSRSTKLTDHEREITFLHHQDEDSISLTDIARHRSYYEAVVAYPIVNLL